MNKKNYFLFLWLLSSLGSIFFVIYTIVENSRASDSPPVAVVFQHIIIKVMLTIVINGIMVAIGLYCAQKIGARLLLLDDNYDFNKDVLKPAVIGALIYSIGAFTLKTLWWKDSLTYISFFDLSYGRLVSSFTALRFDLLTLLLYLSGTAFIIKKLARNLSISIVMPISIGLVTICLNVVPLLKTLLYHRPFIAIDFLFNIMMYLLLSILFWKKGLETAMLSHVIIVALVYWIVPFAMSFIVA